MCEEERNAKHSGSINDKYRSKKPEQIRNAEEQFTKVRYLSDESEDDGKYDEKQGDNGDGEVCKDRSVPVLPHIFPCV